MRLACQLRFEVRKKSEKAAEVPDMNPTVKRISDNTADSSPLNPSDPRTDLSPGAAVEICGILRLLLADVFVLYVKTKNFHWHMTGGHFRDYHLLLDEHADQIFAMTDDIAERVRKIGSPTLRSIGQIAKMQRVLDNDADYV